MGFYGVCGAVLQAAVSMGFLWGFMGFLWGFYGVWGVYRVLWGLWGFIWGSLRATSYPPDHLITVILLITPRPPPNKYPPPNP